MLPPSAMPASLRATIDPPPQPGHVYDTPPVVTRWRRWPRLRRRLQQSVASAGTPVARDAEPFVVGFAGLLSPRDGVSRRAR